MGFLSNIFGKKTNESQTEIYAREFIQLWDDEKFLEAKDLCFNKWTKEYPKDLNCFLAVIMLNAIMESVPLSKLQEAYNLVCGRDYDNYESESKSWYKNMAGKALEEYSFRQNGVPGISNVINIR